jgi:negative regulator of sigma-B (phosphoserine phosphatase)
VNVTHASAVRPYTGLASCGDAAVYVRYGGRHRFVLIDALGHGPDAEKTAQRLTVLLLETGDLEPREVFARCDAALTGTTLRGAAMGALDVEGSVAWFTGVGNIDVYGPVGAKRPVCMPGTLGRRVRNVRTLQVDVQPGSRWVLVSDGLRQRDLQAALRSASALAPLEAATHLIAVAARPDDDASTWVVDFGALQ